MIYRPLSNIGITLLEKIANNSKVNNSRASNNEENKRIEKNHNKLSYKQLVDNIKRKTEDPNYIFDKDKIDLHNIQKGLKELKNRGYARQAEYLELGAEQKKLDSLYARGKDIPLKEVEALNQRVEKFNNKKHISYFDEDELNHMLHEKHGKKYNDTRIHFNNNGMPVKVARNVVKPLTLSKAEQEDFFRKHNVNHVDFSEKNTVFGYHPESIKILDEDNYLQALSDIHKNHLGLSKQFKGNTPLLEKYLAKKYLFLKHRPASVKDDDIKKILGNGAIVEKGYGHVEEMPEFTPHETYNKYRKMSLGTYKMELKAATEVVKNKLKKGGDATREYRKLNHILNSAPDIWSDEKIVAKDLNAMLDNSDKKIEEKAPTVEPNKYKTMNNREYDAALQAAKEAVKNKLKKGYDATEEYEKFNHILNSAPDSWLRIKTEEEKEIEEQTRADRKKYDEEVRRGLAGVKHSPKTIHSDPSVRRYEGKPLEVKEQPIEETSDSATKQKKLDELDLGFSNPHQTTTNKTLGGINNSNPTTTNKTLGGINNSNPTTTNKTLGGINNSNPTTKQKKSIYLYEDAMDLLKQTEKNKPVESNFGYNNSNPTTTNKTLGGINNSNPTTKQKKSIGLESDFPGLQKEKKIAGGVNVEDSAPGFFGSIKKGLSGLVKRFHF